jgi:hypothetical protein
LISDGRDLCQFEVDYDVRANANSVWVARATSLNESQKVQNCFCAVIPAPAERHSPLWPAALMREIHPATKALLSSWQAGVRSADGPSANFLAHGVT